MTTWISLLRGINVGGKNILPMKELREWLDELGYEEVRTYIQSGNCVFSAKASSAQAVTKQIAAKIESEAGFKPMVVTIKKSALDKSAEANPFSQAIDNPASVHFYFMDKKAGKPDLNALSELRKHGEQFELIGSVFYLYAPEGIARSKLAAAVESKLGVSATARNYRTVLKLQELAEGS